jgi:plasmid maintenance system antidote protein VapI
MSSIDTNISLIKGIHPGVILARELRKRKFPKRRFAHAIGEYPQLLGDITLGKRRITPSLSIRLGNALGLDESFFTVLQAYYDIEQEKKKQSLEIHPDFNKIRPVLFWDTDIKTIFWEKHKPSVIKRVFERGNEQEIKEIIRFYGKEDVAVNLGQFKNISPSAKENRKKYL